MHPQSNAESPDQAQWPKIQINPKESWSSQPSHSCTTWPRQINQKKVTTPERHVLKPEPCRVAMPEAGPRSKLRTEVSTAGKRKWKPGTAAGCSTSDKRQGEKRKKAKPGTAASCSAKDKRQGEKWKIASCSTLLRRITKPKIVNSEPGRGSQFLPRKVFPEGPMSSCRIRHESHSCSDLSYRILLWNASVVQNNTSIIPDQRRRTHRIDQSRGSGVRCPKK